MSPNFENHNTQISRALVESLDDWRIRLEEEFPNCRKTKRFLPKYPNNKANFEHPGGTLSHRDIHVTDICEGGLGFVHQGFVHHGTRVVLKLYTVDQETILVEGEVCWCYYLADQMHSVGVKFMTPINLRNFIYEDMWEDHAKDIRDSLWTDKRSAIQLQPCEIESKTMQMLFLNANIECVTATSNGDLMDLVQSEEFDLVILDKCADGVQYDETISMLESVKFYAPIMILSNHQTCDTFFGKFRGVCSIVKKPVSLKSVLSALRDIFEEADDPVHSSIPIKSRLKREDCSDEAITEYVETVQDIGKVLAICISRDDYDHSLKLCSTIYRTATGYGFDLLSEIAEQAVTSLVASGSLMESKNDIRKLTRSIQRIQAR